MAAWGRNLFSLYICIENFKNLLVIDHWTYFNITLQERFFVDPLPSWFKTSGLSKNMAARGWNLFSLYIYIEHFKNLVINHCTDFNITLQECSIGDLLSRFSSSCHDALKNMATRGQGYKIYAEILEH